MDNVPVKTRPPQKELIEIYDQALTSRSWESLKPYPMLLYVWQRRFKADILPIAMWVSHHRTKKHKWCIPDCASAGFEDKQIEYNSAGEPFPF